jgi:very-short-patch-repair endonuclease
MGASRVRIDLCAGRNEERFDWSDACADEARMLKCKLWFALRDRRLGGFKFVRQEAIGSYVVDFVCREKKLVIEVDGGQHADNPKDRARDAALSAEGYNLLRFWNSEILTNQEGVLSVILAKLQGRAL